MYDSLDNKSLITHKLIESFKWLSSIRTRFGDIDNRQELIDKYSNNSWIDELLNNGKYSDNTTFPWQHYDPKYEIVEPQGTSHFQLLMKMIIQYQ